MSAADIYGAAGMVIDELGEKIDNIPGGGGGGGDTKGLLLVKSSDLNQVGATVTVTNLLDSTKTYTDTFSSSLDLLTFLIPGRAKYNVTVTTTSSAVVYDRNVFLNIGEIKEIEVSLDKTTWAGVQSILNSGLEEDLLSVGDEIPIKLATNETITMRIAAINLYEPHSLIWESKYAMLTARRVNPSNTTAGGWSATELRAWLNDQFYDSLPADVKKVIQERTFKVGEGTGKTSLQTLTDKIFLPMEFEVFGTTATTYPAAATEHTVGGNKQWDIYAVAANRIKYLGPSGSATSWWECSPTVHSSYSSTAFCFVNTNGTSNCYYASNAYGVVPCFQMIAADAA